MARIKILGTAGARYVVAKQLRSSAGTWIEHENTRLILDPGPGTLVRMAHARPRLEVEKLHGIILTHAHLDHSNDVNILIDGLTEGGFKRKGVLFSPRECLEGDTAVVLPYLRPFLKGIKILQAEREYKIKEIKFRTSCRHYHTVETYGIIFDFGSKRVGFMVDTLFFPGLIDSYEGCDILVMNVVRYKPHPSPNVQHLCIQDVADILKEIRPEKAVLTHFGMTMLRARPHQVAEKLSRKLGLEVLAAYDGLTLEI